MVLWVASLSSSAPFQIRRPRSDVEKGHGDCSSNAATTAKINRGGEGSHSNFIIWTAAADGRKRKGKDEQVVVADGGDGDGAGTIGGWGAGGRVIDGHFNFAPTPPAAVLTADAQYCSFCEAHFPSNRLKIHEI